jgi:hypothetical protein
MENAANSLMGLRSCDAMKSSILHIRPSLASASSRRDAAHTARDAISFINNRKKTRNASHQE